MDKLVDKLEAIAEIAKIYTDALSKIEQTSFDTKAKELARQALDNAAKIADKAKKDQNYCGAV